MNISSRRLYNAHFLFLTQFYFFNNVVCTLSENACKYFYQATITVGGGVGGFGDRGEDGGLCQISIHKSLAILFILYVFYRPMYMYNKES